MVYKIKYINIITENGNLTYGPSFEISQEVDVQTKNK